MTTQSANAATVDHQGATEVWIRVWLWDTAVAHYRADEGIARLYVGEMQGQLDGFTYTIDRLPSFAPPTRRLPVWHLGQVAP